MFEPLNRLIKRSQNKRPGILLSSQVCYEADKAIQFLVPQAAKNVKVISFSNQCLKLAIGDPSVAHQIKMIENDLMEVINRKIKIGDFKIIYSPKSG